MFNLFFSFESHVLWTLQIIHLLAMRFISSTPYFISVTFHIRLNAQFDNIMKSSPSSPAARRHTKIWLTVSLLKAVYKNEYLNLSCNWKSFIAIHRTSYPASYSEVQHWNLDPETDYPACLISWVPPGKWLNALWNYATTPSFNMNWKHSFIMSLVIQWPHLLLT